MGTSENRLLALDDGLQPTLDTTAAGLVAVAKPFSDDEVDVTSVMPHSMFANRSLASFVDEAVPNEGAIARCCRPGGGSAAEELRDDR
ncbi:MAG: hypothetical protein K2X52_09085 [Mycobacteriaceae bacterium]|nr:hypothetical protein [Mycobacteriaceae bacterium]